LITNTDTSAAEAAKHEGVQIQLFRIIYELVDKIREFMGGLLEPEIKLTKDHIISIFRGLARLLKNI